jgi:hypothetical protein
LDFTDIRTTYYKTNSTTGVLRYDLNGTLTDVPTANYCSYWLYVTPIFDNPLLWVAGHSASTSLPTIRLEQPPDLGAYFPTAESVLIYKVILRNVGGTTTFVETQDYTTSKVTGTSYIPTAHNTLSGREVTDTHPTAAITGLDSALAVRPTFSSVLTNQTWGASGTNATYQIAWDVTNKTFKVLEILP